MLSRTSDKRVVKKAIAASAMPSVGNVGMIGKASIDVSNVTVNGQSISLDANAIGYIDSVTPGTVQANKAVVVDSNKDISGLEDITVNELYVNNGIVTGLVNTGATVSNSVYLNDIQPGVSQPDKILSADSEKNTNANITANSIVANGGTAQTDVINSPTGTGYMMQNLDFYDRKNIQVSISFANTADTSTIKVEKYFKLGNIYVVTSINTATYTTTVKVLRDIHSSAPNQYFTVAACAQVQHYYCSYNATTGVHIIPVLVYASGQFQLIVYTSPTGNPSTWSTAWTTTTVSTCASFGQLTSTLHPPAVRWSTLLNKYVMMGHGTLNTDTYKYSFTRLFGSTDGITWNVISTSPQTSTVLTQLIVTDSYLFLFDISTTYYWSTNGTNWNSKTLAASPLSNPSGCMMYYPELDIVFTFNQGNRKASTIFGLAAGAAWNQSDISYNVHIAPEALPIYHQNGFMSVESTLDGSQSFVWDPNTGLFFNVTGPVMDGLVYFISYRSTTFASAWCWRYAINMNKAEKHVVMPPETFLTFEHKSRGIIRHFDWSEPLNKYVVIGNMDDGFNTANATTLNVYFSRDLENFIYVNVLPTSTVTHVCVNQKNGAIYFYRENGTMANTCVSVDSCKTITNPYASATACQGIYYIECLGTTVTNTANYFLVSVGNPALYFQTSENIEMAYGVTSMSFDPISLNAGFTGTSATAAYGNIVGALAGASATGSNRFGMFGSFGISGSAYTATYGPNVFIPRIFNKNTISVSSFSSIANSYVSGNTYPGAVWVDSVGIYVTVLPNTSYTIANRLIYSYDGRTWIEPAFNSASYNTWSGSATVFDSIKYDRRTGRLYLLGTNGFYQTVHSTRGLKLDQIKSVDLMTAGSSDLWPVSQVANVQVNDLVYCRGQYIACYDGGFYAGSRVGLMTQIIAAGNWKCAAASPETVVIMSSGSVMYGPTVGSLSSVSLVGDWQSVNWSNEVKKFGACCNGTLAWSSDGLSWTTLSLEGAWKSIKYSNGVWIATGLNKIAVSSDSATASVVTITGDWRDSAFGGQWLLVGQGCVAFNNTINDTTSWNVTAGGMYTSVHYNDNLRQFLLTGSDYSVYDQRSNMFLTQVASASAKSVWLPTMQAYYLLGSAIMTTNILGYTLDNTICSNELYRAKVGTSSSSSLSSSIGSTVLNTNGHICTRVTTSDVVTMLSLKNNSDGSEMLVKSTGASGISIESAKGFNLVTSSIKINSLTVPGLTDFSFTTAGASTGGYLSLDSSNNFSYPSLTIDCLVIDGIVCSSLTVPSTTAGSLEANKSAKLDSNKALTNVNQLESFLSFDVLLANVNRPSSFAKYSNGQATTDCSSNTAKDMCYHPNLKLYAAVSNDIGTNTANNLERLYIMVSKDGINWNKCYTGVTGYANRIIPIFPETDLYTMFGLTADCFIICLEAASSTYKMLVSYDLVSFYNLNSNSTLTLTPFESYYGSTSTVYTGECAASGNRSLVIHNAVAAPNKTAYFGADSLSVITLTGNTCASTSIVHAIRIPNSSSNMTYVDSTGFGYGSIIGAQTVVTATGYTITSADIAYNFNGTVNNYMRVATVTGGILYSSSLISFTMTAVTNLVLAAGVNFKSVVWNSFIRRFLIVGAAGNIYISDVGSVTVWTKVTIPNGFVGVTWNLARHAADQGFLITHDNNGMAVTGSKICRVTQDGTFVQMNGSYDRSLAQGAYLPTYGSQPGVYAIPITYSTYNENKVLYSYDGIAWTPTCPTSDGILKIIAVPSLNKLFAITSTESVLMSSNGINWSIVYTHSNAAMVPSDIIFGERLVVIFSGALVDNVVTSEDGSAWTAFSMGSYNVKYIGYLPTIGRYYLSYDDNLYSGFYTNNFTSSTPVAVGGRNINYFPSLGKLQMYNNSQALLYSSSDCVTWTTVTMTNNMTNANVSTSYYSGRTYLNLPKVGEVTVYAVDPAGSCLWGLANNKVTMLGAFEGGMKSDNYVFLIYNSDQNMIMTYKPSSGGRPGEAFQLMDLNESSLKKNREIPIDYLDKCYSDQPLISDYQLIQKTNSTLDGGNADSTALMQSRGSWSSVVTPSFSCIAWSPTVGLFVGLGGSILSTSPDGKTWTPRTAVSNNGWQAVKWIPFINKFVAVAGGGSNRAAWSDNGVTWTPVAIGAILDAGDWRSIATNGSIIVAVANAGTKRVMTSDDGLTWTPRSSADDAAGWSGVAWSQSLGLFVAVAATGTMRAMVSEDGIIWSLRSTGYDTLTWMGVEWVPTIGAFAAVSTSTTTSIIMSYNGHDWFANNSLVGSALYGIMWSSTLNRLCVYSLNASYRIYTSPDGFTWDYAFGLGTTVSPACIADARSINTIVAGVTSATVYTNDYQSQLTYTRNVHATSMSINTSLYSTYFNKWYSVDNFTAVKYSGIYSSSDGFVWEYTKAPNLSFASMIEASISGVPTLVALSGNNPVLTMNVHLSTDGVNWRAYPIGLSTSTLWQSITWSPTLSTFVAVCASGARRVYSSADGKTWTEAASGVNNSKQWYRVAWCDGINKFVASATPVANNFMYSSNGTNWTDSSFNDATVGIESIASSSSLGMAVAVASSSTSRILTSNDGNAWTVRLTSAQTTVSFYNVIWTGTYFIAQCYSTTAAFFVSYDGIKWFGKHIASLASTSAISGVVRNNRMVRFVANSYQTMIDNYLNYPSIVPNTNVIYNMVYAGGVLVALTTLASFKTMRSTDFHTWSNVAAYQPTYAWFGFATNGTDIYASATNGTIMVSTNQGTSWAVAAGLTTSYLRNGCFGDSGYLFVGQSATNRLATSATGSSWAVSTVLDSKAMYGCCFGGPVGAKKYVIVSAPGAGNVIYSTDLSSWNYANSADALTTWMNVTWSDALQLFIAVGQPGTSNVNIMTSPDALVWTPRTSPVPTANMYGVAAGSNCVVAVGTTAGAFFVSSDGINWSMLNTENTADSAYNVIYIPSLDTFAIGLLSGNNNVHYYHHITADSTNLIAPYDDASSTLTCATWTGTKFVGACGSSPACFMVSNDGKNWARNNLTGSTSNTIYGIAYGAPSSVPGGIYVALSNTGTKRISYSYDAIKWTQIAAPNDTATWACVAYAKGIFTAVSPGVSMYSTNGTTWSLGSAATASGAYFDIEYSPSLDLFVAVGTAGANQIATSTDGITWTGSAAPNTNAWGGIAWSPALAMFVAVAWSGTNKAMYSYNGIQWNLTTSADETGGWGRVIWASGYGVFIATNQVASTSANIMISKDGINWVSRRYANGTSQSLSYGLAYSPELGITVLSNMTGTRGHWFTTKQPYDITLPYDIKWDIKYVKQLGQFVAMKQNTVTTGALSLYSSANGYSWTTFAGPSASAAAVTAFADIPIDDCFVMAKSSAAFQAWFPGIDAAEISAASIGNVRSLLFSKYLGSLIVGGSSGSYSLYRINKTAWTFTLVNTVALPAAISIEKIAYINGIHLFIGTTSYYWTKNFSSYTLGSLPAGTWYFCTDSLETRLIAVNESGTIMYTDDAVNWTTTVTGSRKWGNVTYIEEFAAFIACDMSTSSSLLVSIDKGISWQTVGLPSSAKISAVAYSPYIDSFVISTIGSGLMTTVVSLPKIAAPGNVLRYQNPVSALAGGSSNGGKIFHINSRGGITYGSLPASTYDTWATEATPLLSLQMDSAYKPSSGSWTVTSDMRLKTDITKLEPQAATEILKKIDLYYYKWASEVNSEDEHKLGWIAQEVENEVPSAVKTISAYGYDDFKALSSDQLIVVMHGCLQDLIKRYAALKEKLNE
jgi:hypothetical protein